MFNVELAVSLLFTILAFLVALAFIGVLYHRYKRDFRSLRFFILFYIVVILGLLLFLFDNSSPWINTVIANTLVVTGNMCLIKGYKALHKKDMRQRLVIFSMIGFFALTAVLMFVYPSTALRRSLYSIYIIGIHVYLAYFLYEEARRKNMYINVSVLVHVFIVIAQIIRVFNVMVLMQIDPELFNLIEALIIILSGFGGLLIFASLHSILMERLRVQLSEAKREVDRFAEIYHNSPIATMFGNRHGKITHFNDALITLTGLNRETLTAMKWTQGFIAEEDQIEVLKHIQEALNGEENISFETTMRINGLEKQLQVKLSGLKVAKEIYFVAFLNDVTQLRASLEYAEELEVEKARILDNIPGFAYRCANDADWTMELLSENFENVAGYPVEALIGNRDIAYNDLILPEFQEKVHYDWERAVDEKSLYEGEYQIRCADGRVVWVWERGKPIFDGDELIYLEGFITDITYKKEVEDKLEFLSYHDSLTGLYNRRFVEAELARLDVERNLPLSFLKLDIDGLKFANDVFGHRYGDVLIQKVASVLKETLRSDEIIGRMGGDEFLVLLPTNNKQNAELVKDRLLTRFSQIKMQTEVSVSIGSATKTSMEDKTSAVLAEADDKMYSDKVFKKPMVRTNAVRALLDILYKRFPEEEEHVKKATKLALGLAKELKISVLRLEKLKRAVELHRIGMISDHHLSTDCEYRTESAYRIVKAIPDYFDEANIIMNVCERYDGLGHPRGVTSNAIPVESQICAFSMYMCLNNYQEAEPEKINELLDYMNGSWIDPMIIDTYRRMTE